MTRLRRHSRGHLAQSTNAPVCTVSPAITGTPSVGQTLTASNGTWTGSPTFTYKWFRGAIEVMGATAPTYPLLLVDYGLAITVQVTGTNGLGSASATSAGATISAASGPVVSVNSDAALTSAISAAVSGTIIELATGSYATLGLSSYTAPGAGLTIRPATGATVNMAGMELDRSGNLAFAKGAGTAFTMGAGLRGLANLYLTGIANIVFDGLEIVDPAYAAAGGVQLRDSGGTPSSNVTIRNCTLHHLNQGMNIFSSNHIYLLSNTLHGDGTGSLLGDGIDLFEVQFVRIASNDISGINVASGGHADAIQLHSYNLGTPTQSTDIEVDHNYTHRGPQAAGTSGTYAQGIFFGNEMGVAAKYLRVNIHHNNIVGAQGNALAIGDGTDCHMDDNTVLTYTDIGAGVAIEDWLNGTVQRNQLNGGEAAIELLTGSGPNVGVTISGNTNLPAIAPPSPQP